MTPFNWTKRGLLFSPDMPGFTHGSHPCIIKQSDDDFIVAFTCRDPEQRSHIFLCDAKVTGSKIELTGTPKLALEPGALGYFDCDGVISGCFVQAGGINYLYYVGWQNLPDGLWLCDTGRAILDMDTMELTKEFPGPVLGRDKSNPLFAAATAFFVTDDGMWHTWFNSGISWERKEGEWHHKYGFHYASSADGVDWNCQEGMVIPFADEYEYAFGRPSVVRWGRRYHMWFAHRASKDIQTYRIGYASSLDGLSWERNDALSGIDVSKAGWDADMICYPCVFEHKGQKFMLYNGDGYGRTGFGYAVLKENP